MPGTLWKAAREWPYWIVPTWANRRLALQRGSTAPAWHTGGLLTNSFRMKVARLLVDGKVVGWVQGRFEWGPRSLGHRSILADPRRDRMRDHVNRAVKFREAFRPFAPSVIASRAGEFFELPHACRHHPARFMLYVVPVREDQRSALAAVTHVDGTARPQVVHEACQPLYHQLLSAFGGYSGVPVLLNTSFNLRGEPIVSSPADALSTFERSDLDALVIGDCLVEKG